MVYESKEEIAEHIVEYYKGLLGTTSPLGNGVQEEIDTIIKRKLNSAEFMIRDVDEEEIKEVFWSLNSNRGSVVGCCSDASVESAVKSVGRRSCLAGGFGSRWFKVIWVPHGKVCEREIYRQIALRTKGVFLAPRVQSGLYLGRSLFD
ncbi:hypothetical protein U1Q18_014519 [Sarracenia purpurea var. burkii]